MQNLEARVPEQLVDPDKHLKLLPMASVITTPIILQAYEQPNHNQQLRDLFLVVNPVIDQPPQIVLHNPTEDADDDALDILFINLTRGKNFRIGDSEIGITPNDKVASEYLLSPLENKQITKRKILAFLEEKLGKENARKFLKNYSQNISEAVIKNAFDAYFVASGSQFEAGQDIADFWIHFKLTSRICLEQRGKQWFLVIDVTEIQYKLTNDDAAYRSFPGQVRQTFQLTDHGFEHHETIATNPALAEMFLMQDSKIKNESKLKELLEEAKFAELINQAALTVENSKIAEQINLAISGVIDAIEKLEKFDKETSNKIKTALKEFCSSKERDLASFIACLAKINSLIHYSLQYLLKVCKLDRNVISGINEKNPTREFVKNILAGNEYAKLDTKTQLAIINLSPATAASVNSQFAKQVLDTPKFSLRLSPKHIKNIAKRYKDDLAFQDYMAYSYAYDELPTNSPEREKLKALRASGEARNQYISSLLLDEKIPEETRTRNLRSLPNLKSKVRLKEFSIPNRMQILDLALKDNAQETVALFSRPHLIQRGIDWLHAVTPSWLSRNVLPAIGLHRSHYAELQQISKTTTNEISNIVNNLNNGYSEEDKKLRDKLALAFQARLFKVKDDKNGTSLFISESVEFSSLDLNLLISALLEIENDPHTQMISCLLLLAISNDELDSRLLNISDKWGAYQLNHLFELIKSNNELVKAFHNGLLKIFKYYLFTAPFNALEENLNTLIEKINYAKQLELLKNDPFKLKYDVKSKKILVILQFGEQGIYCDLRSICKLLEDPRKIPFLHESFKKNFSNILKDLDKNQLLNLQKELISLENNFFNKLVTTFISRYPKDKVEAVTEELAKFGLPANDKTSPIEQTISKLEKLVNDLNIEDFISMLQTKNSKCLEAIFSSKILKTRLLNFDLNDLSVLLFNNPRIDKSVMIFCFQEYKMNNSAKFVYLLNHEKLREKLFVNLLENIGNSEDSLTKYRVKILLSDETLQNYLAKYLEERNEESIHWSKFLVDNGYNEYAIKTSTDVRQQIQKSLYIAISNSANKLLKKPLLTAQFEDGNCVVREKFEVGFETGSEVSKSLSFVVTAQQ